MAHSHTHTHMKLLDMHGANGRTEITLLSYLYLSAAALLDRYLLTYLYMYAAQY